jgi:uncharacterized protein
VTASAHGQGSTTRSLAQKLAALTRPDTYGQTAPVEVVETHMSYVFLVGRRAYKLKKPVRYPFLDFSTLDARERDCREELRLNRRLAPDVYLGVVALTVDGERLALAGAGVVVDWLVEMRRLPREVMLDHVIAMGGIDDAKLEALIDTLGAFYRRATRSSISADAYLARFLHEERLNREVLTANGVSFRDDAGRLLDALDVRLVDEQETLAARVRGGHVVDGHGDLRPEHVCLDAPVTIFDCLEFNASLRQVDPFDEIAALGVECAQLGAPQLLRRLTEGLGRRLDHTPPWRLVGVYGAARAALRARLSYAHLLEPSPRDPQKWAPLAQRYLDIAVHMLKLDF